MPVLLKHGAKHIASSSGHHTFPRADSNLSKYTLSSAGSRVANVGSNLLQDIRRRSRQPTLNFSQRIRNPKEWIRALKRIYRRYHLKYLIPLAIVMVYMCVGAMIFLWLESGAEEERVDKRRKEYNREMELLVKRMEEIAGDHAARRPENRRKFVQEAIDHFHQQLEIQYNLEPEWTLTSAMYFSGTIFTTIGFGDIACQTLAGRIATVVYAVVGIPIMLMTLNDLGKFLYKTINELVGVYGKKVAWLRSLIHKGGRSSTKADNLSAMEQGNHMHMVSTEEPHHVSFDLRPPSEELTLNLEAFEDGDNHAQEVTAPAEQPPPASEAQPPQSIIANSSAPPIGLRQRSDTAENSLDMLSGPDLNQEEEMLIEAATESPRMPVLVAISITVGWIFVCAALFRLWEDWTYAESLYFVFISLSTIGLGDVSVKRRDLMVLCFAFVIFGLSLVSMCISVIQAALTDLYKRMLMKLLTEYQAKLASGDHRGASMGMMKMWGNSKTAKYLMPMLGANACRTAMAQLQEEARENGIEIPPIFENLDEKTGMPKILTVAQEAIKSDEAAESIYESIVRETDPTRMSMPSRHNVVYFDSSIQTDVTTFEDKNHQTVDIVTDDLAIQTDDEKDVQMDDEGIQTDTVNSSDDQTQTHSIESKDKETNTTTSTSFESTEIQTELISTAEEALQTQEVEVFEVEIQTNVSETKNVRVQTPYPELNDIDVQTDDTDMGEAYKGPSRITQARRRIQQVFASSHSKTPSEQQEPEMNDWKDVESGEDLLSSVESLNWNPIDGKTIKPAVVDTAAHKVLLNTEYSPLSGMHAERQRPVKDLKRLFDRNKGGTIHSTRRKSAK